jgi:outer membrane protein assembly factor BamD (BamD/ComL family)
MNNNRVNVTIFSEHKYSSQLKDLCVNNYRTKLLMTLAKDGWVLSCFAFCRQLRIIALIAAFFLQPITPLFAGQVVQDEIKNPKNGGGVILDEIKISKNGLATTYDIHFGLPLEYLKHFPRNFGEIVQIQLRLGSDTEREMRKEVREGGELLPPGGGESALVYVTYEEGVPGGPYLTLRFSHPVRFEIKPGKDSMSIAVTVFGDKTKSEKGQAQDQEGKTADQMMAKARQAITFGNNKGAIQLLRKIIRLPDHEHTQEANELLGLALERDGQIPRAIFEYRKYLKRFPEGEGANRVKQRLASLRELRARPKRKLRRTSIARARDSFMTFGRFTQAYSEYYVYRDLQGLAQSQQQELQQRLLSSYFSVKSRYRSDKRTILGVFDANHTYDFLAGKQDRQNEKISDGEIQRFYLDVDDRAYNVAGKFGRQSSRNGGVYGTFDGAVAGYRVTPQWLISAMAGNPIIRTYSDIKIYKKSFYGMKAEVTSENKQVGGNLFYVNQKVDGISDREAIGGDIRYARKGLSIFGLLDYDVSYKDLSLFDLRIGVNYTEANRLNLSFNRRHLLMTSRALEGMSITTIEELRNYLPEEEIRRIAEERTRKDDTFTIGNSYQINQYQQFNADVTIMRSSGSPQGVDPVKQAQLLVDPTLTLDPTVYSVPGTGNQFIYSLQWISSNTFKERDLYVVGLRRSQFSYYKDNTIFINARVPLTNQWWPGFRLSYSNRDSNTYGKRTTISPAIKINYRVNKAWSFDGDIGFDIVKDESMPNEVRTRARMAYNYIF